MLNDIIDEMYSDRIPSMSIWDFVYHSTDLVTITDIMKTYCTDTQKYTDFCEYFNRFILYNSEVSDFDDWGENGWFQDHNSDTLYQLLLNALSEFDDLDK